MPDDENYNVMHPLKHQPQKLNVHTEITSAQLDCTSDSVATLKKEMCFLGIRLE